MEPLKKPLLYTAPEAAKMLRISKTKLYEEVKAGRLNALIPRGRKRGYRFSIQDLNDWIENMDSVK